MDSSGTSGVTIRSFEDRAILVRAYQQLEKPGMVRRVNNIVATPLEITAKLLPLRWSQNLHRLVRSGIERILSKAISTLSRGTNLADNDSLHSTLVSFSGAASGSLGLAGLAADLPLTTAVILRSVASIARKEGENLATLDARTACISVLAMGGRVRGENQAKTDYYAVRLTLADALYEGAAGFTLRAVHANATAKLLPLVGSRFSAVVSQKIPSQSVPLIGAFGGATVNVMIMRHFQRMAHGHFAIRRLERKYGPEVVMQEYEALN